MRYIAALDYEHLDNGVFLTTLARSLSQLQNKKNVRSVIIHSDSAYTERIIQTGVMRKEATLRSVKDLNNRLVALFADQGVSAIGINPYQRQLITKRGNKLQADRDFFENLPERSTILLSTAVYDYEKKEAVVLSLPELSRFLHTELEADELFLFLPSDEAEIFANSQKDEKRSWRTIKEEFKDQNIPEEFRNYNYSARLTSARDLNQLPDLDHSLLIQKD